MILTALFVILGIILFFVLVGMIAVRVHIVYDGAVKLYLTVMGIIKIRIMPSDKALLDDPDLTPLEKEKLREKIIKAEKKKKIKAKKKKQKKKAKAEAERRKRLAAENAEREKKPDEKPEVKKKKKLDFKQILYLVKLLLRVLKVFFGKFGKYLYIKAVRIKIKVASEDAASTAKMYGIVSAALSDVMALLSQMANFKAVSKEDVGVYADFLSDKMEMDVHIVLRIRVGQVLSMIFASLFAALVYFIKHPMPSSEKDKKDGHKHVKGKRKKPSKKEKNKRKNKQSRDDDPKNK